MYWSLDSSIVSCAPQSIEALCTRADSVLIRTANSKDFDGLYVLLLTYCLLQLCCYCIK